MSVRRVSDLPNLGTTYSKTMQNGRLAQDQLSSCLIEISYNPTGKVYQSFYEHLDKVIPDVDPDRIVSAGLKPATAVHLGGVKIGDNVCMCQDAAGISSILSVRDADYDLNVHGTLKLPAASTNYMYSGDEPSPDIQFLGLQNNKLVVRNLPTVIQYVSDGQLTYDQFDAVYPMGTIYTSLQNYLPESFKGVWRRIDVDLALWNTQCSSYSEFGKILNPTMPIPNASIVQTPLSAVPTGSTGSNYGIAIKKGGNITSDNEKYVRDHTLDSHVRVNVNYENPSISAGSWFFPRPRRFCCSMWVRCNALSSYVSRDVENLSSGLSEPIELIKMTENGVDHFDVFCYANGRAKSNYRQVGQIYNNLSTYTSASITKTYTNEEEE